MKKCCQMLAKYFGVMAVVFLVLGLVTPTSWLWILGKVHFASMPTAVVPGAIFSAWFTISGAVLAWACVNYLNPRFGGETEEETVAVTKLAAN